MEDIQINNLLNLEETIAKKIFEKSKFAWEVLPKISDFIIELGNSLDKQKFNQISENIWIAKTATIAQSSFITGPCIIDENAQIRHSAFIRGNAIIGKNVVVRKFNRIKKHYFI